MPKLTTLSRQTVHRIITLASSSGRITRTHPRTIIIRSTGRATLTSSKLRTRMRQGAFFTRPIMHRVITNTANTKRITITSVTALGTITWNTSSISICWGRGGRPTSAAIIRRTMFWVKANTRSSSSITSTKPTTIIIH